MHKWETVSLDNVTYILDSDEFKQAQPVKFYILRGNETLYGHMLVSYR
jgi:serine protease Do